jgi:hypothetical protein
MKNSALLFFLIVLIPALGYGDENNVNVSGEAHVAIANLSPELRDLFSREMVELQNGMMNMVPLYVSGQWAEIAAIAGRMERSYVLTKNLSELQMHELHEKLPSAFVRLDQQFHYFAGMLKHAARMEKVELVGFYTSKMAEACVGCHSEYATHKFPALAPKRRVDHSH